MIHIEEENAGIPNELGTTRLDDEKKEHFSPQKSAKIERVRYYPEDYPVVLFDSQCLICDGFVKRIIKWDKEKVLKFSGLQSDKAMYEINRRGISMSENGSVVLLFKDRYATESDAVIEILEITGKSSLFIQLLRGVPKRWRDVVYRWVARNRYRFYKKRDYCPLPEPSEAGRFV